MRYPREIIDMAFAIILEGPSKHSLEDCKTAWKIADELCRTRRAIGCGTDSADAWRQTGSIPAASSRARSRRTCRSCR